MVAGADNSQDENLYRPKRKLDLLTVLTVLSVGLVVLATGRFLLRSYIREGEERERRTSWEISQCGYRMTGLAMALQAYASDCDYHYPPPDKWCDLLMQWQYVEQKKMFICPRALALGDEGPCHYAINPDASATCPPDTVLLFPTRGGWNQFGGADMLTTENHQHVCFVAFVDKIDKVRPVKTNELGKLKWKADAPDMSRIMVGPRNTVLWEDAKKIIIEGDVKAVSQSHSRDVLVEMKDGTIYRTTEPRLDDVLRLLKETGRDKEILYATE